MSGRFRPSLNAPTLLLAAVCFLLLLNISGNLIWVGARVHELQDLGSFLHSGAAHEQGVDPYGYHWWLFPQPISQEALNLNPPISVYSFAPLASLDATLVRDGFLLGSTMLYTGVVGALMVVYPGKRSLLFVLLAFSLAGVWHLIGYLQIYAPLLAAAAGSWLLMRRGNLLLAGVLIGLVVAMKPNFIVWPLFLLVAGHRGVALPALAMAAAVSAVPLLIDGPAIYAQWLHYTLIFDGFQWTSNASLVSVAGRFGLPELAGTGLAALLGAAMLYWQWRRRPGLLDTTTGATLTVLALGPVSWVGYTLFLLPFFFSTRWRTVTWVAAALLCVPYWLVGPASAQGPIANALVGPIYAWPVLLLLGDFVTREMRALEGLPRPRVLLAKLGGAAGARPVVPAAEAPGVSRAPAFQEG